MVIYLSVYISICFHIYMFNCVYLSIYLFIFPFLSYPILSSPGLSPPIPSHPSILSWHLSLYAIRSYLILSYRFLSYPIYLSAYLFPYCNTVPFGKGIFFYVNVGFHNFSFHKNSHSFTSIPAISPFCCQLWWLFFGIVRPIGKSAAV